jgi:hypothetical protein
MRRLFVLPLILCLFAAASGAAGYLHEVGHDEHDVHHHHDEAHCVIHATLASPSIAGGWTPVPVSLGLIVAVLTELPRVCRSQPTFAWIDCRGPPWRD